MRWGWARSRHGTAAGVLSVVAVAAGLWGLGELGALPRWHLPSRDAIERFLRANLLGTLLVTVSVVAAAGAARSWLAVPGVRSWVRSRRFLRRVAPAPDGSAATSPPPDWTKITSLVTSFTAVAALIFTALSLQASREQNEVAQEGLITERYTRAVDQLGTPGPQHLQVRLGGVYALERLAQDSPRDRDTIVDVLAAFIRSSSPRTDAPCPATAPADIQAAFTVLGRRPPAARWNDVVDLRQTCLTGVQGNSLRLEAMGFIGADLSDADLDGAHANLTVFNGATMQRATLRRLQSDGQDGSLFFEDADLRDALLNDADLRHVDFGRANLSGADLSGADLSGADLSQVTRDDRTVVQHVRTDDHTKGMWELP